MTHPEKPTKPKHPSTDINKKDEKSHPEKPTKPKNP